MVFVYMVESARKKLIPMSVSASCQFFSDMYCKEPANIAHGDYRCNPNHCDMFKVGTEVHYICDQGYEPKGEVQQTCVRGGQWSAEQPACLPGEEPDM